MMSGILLGTCAIFGVAVARHLGILDGLAAGAVLFVLAPYPPGGRL